MRNSRLEQDLAGKMEVPGDAYYGIHSLRAAQNFPITGRRLPETLIQHLALVKKACAMANASAEAIPAPVAKAICNACDEIVQGKLHDQFIVDPIQGGAGTSTNMNANEVIANRAIELLGGELGDYALVHPNDHVNCAQSTNDVYPTVLRMTLYRAVSPLVSALDGMLETLDRLAKELDDVVMLGRTQLQDAVPIRAGQIFAGYAAGLRREKKRLLEAQQELLTINLGGTAIGTGVNASPVYLRQVIPTLAALSALPVKRSDNCIDATQNADSYVALSAALKSCAVFLSKMSNDLRLRSSGPVGGLGDWRLPARQNGSSIMPGKVNPVIPEVVNQIAFRIIGFDTTVTMAAEAGQLELNAFEPVIFDSLYQGCTQLCQGVRTLDCNCLQGICINEEHCRKTVERSASMATAVCPQLGYAKACELAGEALEKQTTVRALVKEQGLMSDEEADECLNPFPMTQPLDE